MNSYYTGNVMSSLFIFSTDPLLIKMNSLTSFNDTRDQSNDSEHFSFVQYSLSEFVVNCTNEACRIKS